MSNTLGPVNGAALLQNIQLEKPGTSLAERQQLFSSVLAANPEYLPGVASQAVPFQEWYLRKSFEWVRAARSQADNGRIIGHVGLRLNGALPDRRLLEEAGGPRLAWELSALVVKPGFRGCGVAQLLVEEALRAVPVTLWASVHANGPGFHLLHKLGWRETIPMQWPNDPRPGVIMVSA